MRTAITGASGRLGRLVAGALLARSEPEQVVLVSREPAAVAEPALGDVSARFGDFDQPDSLADAFAGVDKLLLISTSAGGSRVAQHRAAVEGAERAGVRAIAYTSMVNPSDSNPAFVADEHRDTEELLRASGLEWTLLRNSVYTEMLLPTLSRALTSGQLPTNEGEGRTAYVSRADCAAAAAAVLATDGHAGKTYDITGPQAVSADEVAAIVAELAGAPLEVVQLTDEQWISGIVQATGLPQAAARGYSTLGAATRAGYLTPVSQTVADLTGRSPASVRDVLTRHRTQLLAPHAIAV